MSEPLTRIAVFGGGIVGLSAATALARALPRVKIDLVATPVDPAALADRLPGALPALGLFNETIGFPESDMLRRTGAMHRLATRFEGWSAEGTAWLFGYGTPGPPDAAGFVHHWTAARDDGDAGPIAEYHQGAMLAAAGQFVADVDYALTIHPAGYHAGLTALALHRGVAVTRGSVAAVDRHNCGIAAVTLDDGRRFAADLFIDATGPTARLMAALDPAFEDWSGLLPADRLMLGEAPPAPVLYDTVTAFAQGWCGRIPGRARSLLVMTYSNATPDDQAASLFTAGTGHAPREQLSFRPGRRRSWIGNVVAVGDAAVVVDPLHATNLQLAHGAILRLLNLLPDRRFAPALRDEFNRRTLCETGRVRDFLAMHYRHSPHAGFFWRRAAQASPPNSLAETLALLKARARLPHFEEETFHPAEWQMAAIGLGVLPAQIDAIALAMPRQARLALLHSARQRIATMLRSAPSYPDALARLLGR